MITKIEKALIDRLQRGLGQLVQGVASYAGELDDERLAVRKLPVALVSYGGSTLKPLSMTARGSRMQSQDTFVVIVLTRSLRAGTAGFQGGASYREVGANQLVYAVKYLLTNQTFDGLISPLKPIRVRTLWNSQEIAKERLSAYAIEFEASYTDLSALEDGKFPEGSDDPSHPEFLFGQYRGELEPSEPDLLHIGGVIYDPTTNDNVKFEVNCNE